MCGWEIRDGTWPCSFLAVIDGSLCILRETFVRFLFDIGWLVCERHLTHMRVTFLDK